MDDDAIHIIEPAQREQLLEIADRDRQRGAAQDLDVRVARLDGSVDGLDRLVIIFLACRIAVVCAISAPCEL